MRRCGAALATAAVMWQLARCDLTYTLSTSTTRMSVAIEKAKGAAAWCDVWDASSYLWRQSMADERERSKFFGYYQIKVPGLLRRERKPDSDCKPPRARALLAFPREASEGKAPRWLGERKPLAPDLPPELPRDETANAHLLDRAGI